MAIVYNPQSELLREPNLLVPRLRPVGSVKFAPGYNPVFSFLYGHWYGTRDIKTGIIADLKAFTKVDTDHVTTESSGSNDRQDINDFVSGITPPYTFIHHCHWTGFNGYNYLYDQTNRFILTYHGSTGDDTFQIYDGSWNTIGGAGSSGPFYGKECVTVWVIGASVSTIAVNGVLIGSASVTAKNLGSEARLFDRYAHTGANNFHGDTYSCTLLNQAFSEGEAVELSEDPYQFLIPA